MISKAFTDSAFGKNNYNNFKLISRQINANLDCFKNMKKYLSHGIATKTKAQKRFHSTAQVKLDIKLPLGPESMRLTVNHDQNIRAQHIMQRTSMHKLSLCTKDLNQIQKIKLSASRPQPFRNLEANRSIIIKENRVGLDDSKMKKIYYRLQKFVNPAFKKFETTQPSNGNHVFYKLKNHSQSVKRMSASDKLIITHVRN